MAFTKFDGPIQVFLRGRLLGQTNNARISTRGNNNKVFTFGGGSGVGGRGGGLAGKSDGPRETEATIDNAIPVAGMEDDFVGLMKDGTEIRLAWIAGGKRYHADGWIENVDLTAATQQAAGVSFDFQGGPVEIL